MTPRTEAAQPRFAPATRPTRARYYVLLLSFLVGLVMFLDRACMGAATPMIMREFGLDKIAMGWSVSAFNWTYALFQVPGGWLADRFGSRIVLSVAIAWWSIFTAATGAAFSASSLAVMRGLFGLGEAAAWPSASRSLHRWLPSRQRAFGQGFQHSGARLGAAFAPTLVVFLIAHYGWRGVFYIFGAAGILVAVWWYAYYRDLPHEHRGVNQAELALMDNALRPVPFRPAVAPGHDLRLRDPRAPQGAEPGQASQSRPTVPWGRILRSRDPRFPQAAEPAQASQARPTVPWGRILRSRDRRSPQAAEPAQASQARPTVPWGRILRSRDPRAPQAAEPAQASQAPARPAVPWGRILRSRDLRNLSLMYFCYGWVFWMYLQWLPTYLAEVRHFAEIKMGLGASLPLLAGTAMNIAGGWLSDRLARRWGDLRRGRTLVAAAGFTLAGLAILPGVLANSAAVGLACLTLALAGLELTVPVAWALCLDIAGDFSGSVTGVMNTLGNIGGALSAVMVGYLATVFGWTVPFVVCSALCAIAALLATRIDPNRSAVAEFQESLK